jgi:DNA-binding response OmpR family regulator
MLDVDMPAMDGFAVCREIRHQEVGGTVPIIMVTGGDELEAVTRAYEVGATDFVSKPINWPILGHRVLYVLRASDAIAACASPTRSTAPCWPPSPTPSSA